MIDTNNIEKAKKIIKEADEKPIIVVAQDDVFNRKILEYGNFDVLLNVENLNGKDSLRQIDSGFNQVLAKIAYKKGISLGINFDKLAFYEKKEKAILLSKIKQNILICRKAGVKIKALNFKEEKDVFSLLITLGASTKQAWEAISF